VAAGTTHDIVDRYVEAVKRSDVEGFDAALADDVVEVYPQSGERFHGRANVRAIFEHYPGGDPPSRVDDTIGLEDRWIRTPAQATVRVSGGGEAYTLVGRVSYPNGEEWHVVQLLRVRSGGITHLTTYFAPQFEPADWRAPFRDDS
jgi:hypothetical protein